MTDAPPPWAAEMEARLKAHAAELAAQSEARLVAGLAYAMAKTLRPRPPEISLTGIQRASGCLSTGHACMSGNHECTCAAIAAEIRTNPKDQA